MPKFDQSPYRTAFGRQKDFENGAALVAGLAVIAAVIGFLWIKSSRENALIASGECEVAEEGIYDPPLEMWTNSDGHLRSRDPDPYWRTVYRCPGNRIVTRRANRW